MMTNQTETNTRCCIVGGGPSGIPLLLRWLLKFRLVRNIPARIIGYGFDRENVET
jgi:hypothetical protein